MSNELTVTAPEYRSVYNDSGGTLAKGTVVAIETTPARSVVAITAATDPVYGVLAEDVADLSWGKCQIRGIALTMCHAAVTVGLRVGYGDTGEVITASAGDHVVGIALTAGGTTALAEVELSGPGAARMPG